MNLILKYCFFAIYIICTFNAECYTADQTKALINNLTTGYNKNIKPRYNQSELITVRITLDVISIQDFDEVKEVLAIVGYLHIRWYDDFLTWNPEDYGTISNTSIINDVLWKPPIILVNKVNKIENLMDSWQKVRVLHTGDVFYFPVGTHSVTCTPDITYYPFDSHTCYFNFSLWEYYETEVVLKPFTKEVLRTYYTANGAWDFLGSRVDKNLFGSLSFGLYLKRKPWFVLFNVIVPMTLMVFLNAFVFFIPAECGERISYGVTVVLAIAVFLTLVGENLPKTSSPMPIISFYLLALLITSILITAASIFSLRIYHQTSSENVTSFMYQIEKLCRSKSINWKQKKLKNETDLHNLKNNVQGSKKNHMERNVSKMDGSPPVSTILSDLHGRNKHLNFTNRDNTQSIEERPEEESSLNEKDSKDNTEGTWKDISVALDKMFFALFIVLFTVETVVFFAIVTLKP
ncbi:neuronal acetylcholine receptor subunit alpha-2-like [Mercenaria mercenaria]|uniref:neuronal acetylcholine receptor subunit alpha-2-like n=1 Tax=Mercenaria mercenaria TaxID=6596 RepID=UPI00234F0BEE|nr:neuronal acetylcholine receptor subunit alpha-2-like [Mercenaria mercenaria]